MSWQRKEDMAISEGHYPEGYRILASFGQCCFDSGRILLAARGADAVVVRRYSLEHWRNRMTSLAAEARLMRHLRHDNLLPLVDCFVMGTDLCLVVPIADHGSALDLIQVSLPSLTQQLLYLLHTICNVIPPSNLPYLALYDKSRLRAVQKLLSKII